MAHSGQTMAHSGQTINPLIQVGALPNLVTKPTDQTFVSQFGFLATLSVAAAECHLTE